MKNTFTILLIALWITGMTTGFAMEPEECPTEAPREQTRHMGGKGGGLASELGLSKEKRAEMKEKMHETRKLMIRLKAERDAAKAELEHLMDADSVDEGAVLAAADKLAQVSGDIIKARVKSKLNMISMLTPEQREKMKELRKSMHQRRQKRMEKGRGSRSEGQGYDEGEQPIPPPEPEDID